MSIDVDGKTVYSELADITGERYYDGLQRVRDVEGFPIVLRQKTGWATVLLAVQDYDVKQYKDRWSPVRFIFSRWIRRAGAWRRTATFNVRGTDVLLAAKAVIELRAKGEQIT